MFVLTCFLDGLLMFDCHKSTYGCCQDGKMAATGPNMEGCKQENVTKPEVTGVTEEQTTSSYLTTPKPGLIIDSHVKVILVIEHKRIKIAKSFLDLFMSTLRITRCPFAILLKSLL